MIRERALKIVLVIVGLLFVATVYGLVKLREEETLQMMLSIYVTLGSFPAACITQPLRESQPDRLHNLAPELRFSAACEAVPLPERWRAVLERTAPSTMLRAGLAAVPTQTSEMPVLHARLPIE